MNLNKDDELQHKITDLVVAHFKETGKVLSGISFKYDTPNLNNNIIVITGYSRRWKWPKAKKTNPTMN